MRTRKAKIIFIIFSVVLGLQSYIILPHDFTPVNAVLGATPQLIRQGPIQTTTLAPTGFYWYQIGAIGDSNSQNDDGASITIRTVYDVVNNDAHSYWVGLSFAGGQFVQVGYLNGLSTTGQPYCCAWFFETFTTPSCDCPPVIGVEGSAGPVGSWHTYSISYTGNGVWSFYMDNQLLGHSPLQGQANYLGTGTASSGSCQVVCAPAGIAEVAQASDNTDVIGPAEFKDLMMHKNGSWQAVGAATTYCCNGYSSNDILPISYGLAEIQNINNDYLAGTHIRPSAKGTPLWPVSSGFSNTVSFNFIDRNGNSFSPDWISLQDPGNQNLVYYTTYQSQSVPLSSTGTYTITYEYWHGVNVSKNTSVSDSSLSQTAQGDVFSIPVRVTGRFYSLPVPGATLRTFLPDTTNQTVKTDSEGNATLYQIPPGNYSLRITPPFGVPSVSKTAIAGPVNISVSVFSIAELLTIVVPPIAIAIAFVVLALRREQARRAAMAAASPYPMTIPITYCRACGKPFGPTEYFCTTCGTPRPNNFPPVPSTSQEQPPPPQRRRHLHQCRLLLRHRPSDHSIRGSLILNALARRFLIGFLPQKIGIIGVGYSGFDSMTPGLSTRELMFEAASRAYEDAGIDPRKDVQSFVCCTEDFWEGISITDEYMPDQLGAVLRPLCTISSDGIVGLATACMQIMSGIADVAVVESHSKISDVRNPDEIASFALDPVYTHHVNADPRFVAGLEMARYLKETGTKREYLAQVAVKNKKNALLNPRGVHGANLDKDTVLESKVAASPLTELESSNTIDGSIVFVLASTQKAKKLGGHTVWINGIGWSSDTPWVEDRDLAKAEYVEQSASRAYKMAGVRSPASYFDLAEVDDTYSYKEPQSLEALKLAARGKAGKMIDSGAFDRDGRLPVNPSGGSLGVGHLLEATGLHRVLEAVQQLRGQAGRLQVPKARKAVVQSWRGIPTATGAVAVLGN